mmetsp:Transcript_16737/g.36565  ORF Transcript_16737/g.36565 Transcript_16737/m.36565 type:complete len:259 (+) Transcript_16737:114-890(+)
MTLTPVKNVKLPKNLVAPSKIAKFLDWKKHSEALLSIHIGRQSIDLAVTNHPESRSRSSCIRPVPAIPLEYEIVNNQKLLAPRVVKELFHVMDKFRICGLLVSWPVQQDGWCGAGCGKVLHNLEQIVAVNEGSPSLSSFPICLWNGHHWVSSEDEWGRLAHYGVPPQEGKTKHVASQEQYTNDGMLAADIASDFIRYHWPSLPSTPLHPAETALGSSSSLAIKPRMRGSRSSSPSSPPTKKTYALNSLLASFMTTPGQ